ncbi:unnamed protein product [Agarophyton chilense]
MYALEPPERKAKRHYHHIPVVSTKSLDAPSNGQSVPCPMECKNCDENGHDDTFVKDNDLLLADRAQCEEQHAEQDAHDASPDAQISQSKESSEDSLPPEVQNSNAQACNTVDLEEFAIHSRSEESHLVQCETERYTESQTRDLLVTEQQYKAAMFILTFGPCNIGLYGSMTTEYLNSLPHEREVPQKWKTAKAFREDHFARQQQLHPQNSRWRKHKNLPPRPEVPVDIALVRFLPDAICSVVRASNALKLSDLDWDRDLTLCYGPVFNVAGQRVVYDFQTADDLIFLERAILEKARTPGLRVAALQLFIDKENVTCLNKRSMYPIVLYLLCFSRRVRRRLAINVGMIPVVSGLGRDGRKMPKELTRLALATTIQQTLESLLSPLEPNLKIEVHFPGSGKQIITPVLFSIVADLPEVAVILGMKYGLRTIYPCFRCFVPRESMSQLECAFQLKTSTFLRKVHDALPTQRTNTARQELLKKYSLRVPASPLLQRQEMNFDVPRQDAAGGRRGVVQSNKFGLHALCRFESLHNFDLGITADILHGIEKYFAHRLGTIIAESHANMTAQQYKSSLCVLPFILIRACKGVTTNSTPEVMFHLLECILSYIELHHYCRRINHVSYFLYARVEQDVRALTNMFYNTYKVSIGAAQRGRVSNSDGSNEDALGTMMAHQLYAHIARDIKSGGLLSNYDAQVGESNHVQTRAHYNRTSKRLEAEESVAIRSTTRELGVQASMYPIRSASSRETGERLISGRRTRSQRQEENSDDNPFLPVTKRVKLKVQTVNEALLDGMCAASFTSLLKKTYPGEDPGSFRSLVRKLKIKQSVRVPAHFLWMPASGEGSSVPNAPPEQVRRIIRSSPSFYNSLPQHDFIEIKTGGEHALGQVRVIFFHPFDARSLQEKNSIWLLIRLLTKSTASITNNLNDIEETLQHATDELLERYGCHRLRWAQNSEGSFVHTVIPVHDVVRPVSIVPDFRHTSTNLEVVNDLSRRSSVRGEIEQGQASSPSGHNERRDVGRLAPGPEKQRAAFFYNNFLSWTSPST